MDLQGRLINDASSSSYDLVVGADGIASRLRALTFGTIARAYSGAMAWRSVALSRPLGPPAAPPNELEDIDAGMIQTPQQHGLETGKNLGEFQLARRFHFDIPYLTRRYA